MANETVCYHAYGHPSSSPNMYFYSPCRLRRDICNSVTHTLEQTPVQEERRKPDWNESHLGLSVDGGKTVFVGRLENLASPLDSVVIANYPCHELSAI